MCGFIAQLVEQRTGNAEVTGSNPVEALIFFRLLLSNWKFTAMIILHFHILYCYSVTLLPFYSVTLLLCPLVILFLFYPVTLFLCSLVTLLSIF